MNCVNSFNLDQSRHLDQLFGLSGALPVRNTVSSCERGGSGLPAILATGEVK